MVQAEQNMTDFGSENENTRFFKVHNPLIWKYFSSQFYFQRGKTIHLKDLWGTVFESQWRHIWHRYKMSQLTCELAHFVMAFLVFSVNTPSWSLYNLSCHVFTHVNSVSKDFACQATENNFSLCTAWKNMCWYIKILL